MNRDALVVVGAIVVWIGFLLFWFDGIVDVTSVGFITGLVLTTVVVVMHFAEGTGWDASEDISQDVLEHRAETVPETEFAEPMNRSIGGGAVSSAIAAGESEGELEESEEEAAGFDPDALSEDEIEVYEIEFAKEGQTLEVANNETILDAGEDEGWDLPYACREGQCLSCSAHIEDGSADEYIRHIQNDTLNQEEMDDGYCLTCVACPTESFTIETSESP